MMSFPCSTLDKEPDLVRPDSVPKGCTLKFGEIPILVREDVRRLVRLMVSVSPLRRFVHMLASNKLPTVSSSLRLKGSKPTFAWYDHPELSFHDLSRMWWTIWFMVLQQQALPRQE